VVRPRTTMPDYSAKYPIIREYRKSDPMAYNAWRATEGRPPVYNPKTAPGTVYKLCARYGLTDEGLCTALSVSITALEEWKQKYPKFGGAIRDGRDVYMVAKGEISLLRKAIGYETREKTYEPVYNPETKKYEMGLAKITERHVPPSDTSLIFMLTNRNPERWKRNAGDSDGVGGSNGNVDISVKIQFASITNNGHEQQKVIDVG